MTPKSSRARALWRPPDSPPAPTFARSPRRRLLSQYRMGWAAGVAAVGRPRAAKPAAGDAGAGAPGGLAAAVATVAAAAPPPRTATAAMRGNVEVLLSSPSARKLKLAAWNAAIAAARAAGLAADVPTMQVETSLEIDPAIVAAIAAFNTRSYPGDRTAEVSGGISRFFLRDFVDGFGPEFKACAPPVVHLRVLLDILLTG